MVVAVEIDNPAPGPSTRPEDTNDVFEGSDDAVEVGAKLEFADDDTPPRPPKVEFELEIVASPEIPDPAACKPTGICNGKFVEDTDAELVVEEDDTRTEDADTDAELGLAGAPNAEFTFFNCP